MSTTVDQNAAATDPRAIMAKAKAEVAAHLPELARELVVWRDTALLPDGRLRRIARALSTFAPEDSLRIAEDLVKNAAVDLAARS